MPPIIRGMIDLGHTPGLETVAEGVDTEAQRQLQLEGRCETGSRLEPVNQRGLPRRCSDYLQQIWSNLKRPLGWDQNRDGLRGWP